MPCVQARNILIATGARATVPAIPGAEHAIISDDILDLPQLPAKLAIIGGGYIALEFAGIYNNFGSETHVFYRQVSGLGVSNLEVPLVWRPLENWVLGCSVLGFGLRSSIKGGL